MQYEATDIWPHMYDGKEESFCCRRKILMSLYVKGEGKVQQVDEIIVHMWQRRKKAWLSRLFFVTIAFMVWKFYSYGSL